MFYLNSGIKGFGIPPRFWIPLLQSILLYILPPTKYSTAIMIIRLSGHQAMVSGPGTPFDVALNQVCDREKIKWITTVKDFEDALPASESVECV